MKPDFIPWYHYNAHVTNECNRTFLVHGTTMQMRSGRRYSIPPQLPTNHDRYATIYLQVKNYRRLPTHPTLVRYLLMICA